MSTIEATPTVPPKTLATEPNKDFMRASRSPESTVTAGSTDQNLDMVRNILFGEQVRENEKRQAALERFVRVSVNAWTEDTQRRFDHLQREIQLLKDLLQDETKARRDDTQLTKDRLDEVGRQLTDLDKKQKVTSDESQGLLQKEVLRIEQSISTTREQLQSQLEQALNQLRQDKPDRKALAMMLQGVAKQLYDGVKE
ncbi:MAG: hypothetical protein WAQ53_07310 [Thiofilum sp.]|uniref:hypothetical protein n=1 Tax=Thiofilum sp. TaxID=2212733 RepID=UPI0025EF606B|nr:hypothetical protein [Thiofilum sp.]MBK8455248.1 hypothetical protein [Thiofilum sp.]